MSTATAYDLPATLRGILQESGYSPRELTETLSKSLSIPYWEASNLLEAFLGHEVPENDSGTVRLDGRWVILNIPGVVKDHHVELTT